MDTPAQDTTEASWGELGARGQDSWADGLELKPVEQLLWSRAGLRRQGRRGDVNNHVTASGD